MNSTRQQQLLSLIKRIVSTELQEIDHELFHAVVVTNVLLSNDGRECRIWVQAPETAINALNKKYHRELQHLFMKKYSRKAIPKLVFLADTGEITHIEELLETIDG